METKLLPLFIYKKHFTRVHVKLSSTAYCKGKVHGQSRPWFGEPERWAEQKCPLLWGIKTYVSCKIMQTGVMEKDPTLFLMVVKSITHACSLINGNSKNAPQILNVLP